MTSVSKVLVVPATVSLITDFYGEPPSKTQKSFAILEEGNVVSIVGVYRNSGKAVLFSDSKPQVEENKKHYARAAVKSMKLLLPYMKEIGAVMSVADEKIHRSVEFLEHFGFIKNGEVFIWQK